MVSAGLSLLGMRILTMTYCLLLGSSYVESAPNGWFSTCTVLLTGAVLPGSCPSQDLLAVW